MAIAFAGPLSRHFASSSGDAARLRAGVEAWRDDLRAVVADKVRAQLVWDEAVDVAFTADLGASGWLAVRLLGLLADRTDLEWPDTVPPLLELDPEWRAAADAKFARSHFGQLLACTTWLPGDFPVTFRVPLPDGQSAEVGSVAVLADQLGRLNQRTFQADAATLAAWRACPAPPAGDFVAAARR
ncbi:MAG: hypothetical protein WBO45_22940, partial [Planctomycetota bacterium]